jgi:ABC-type phosphate/phosphonate transport system substrate-binding protein
MRAIKFPIHAAWTEPALLALVIGVGLAVAWLVASNGIEYHAPSSKYYNSYSCNTMQIDHHTRNDGAVFRILDVFRLNTNVLAEQLCASPAISARYNRVEVSWMHRDQLDLREIVNQSYQVLLAKPELLQRLTETHATAYASLASYQEYVSQLISTKTTPALNNDYLAGKRLGLLDDPNSLSGYQIPKAAMQRAHIDESAVTIVFFKSHADLHRALFVGQVDVIASYSAAYFRDDLVTTKRLDLQRGLSGMQWYMHPVLVDTDIHCEVVRHLAGFSSAMGAPSSISRPAMECENAG